MVKKESGITLISLIVTIIIILILSTTAIRNYNTGIEYNNYKKMLADIELIREQVLTYYNNYGEIPKMGQVINAEQVQEADGETGNFYRVDLSKLSNMTLNYGTGNSDDIYIINAESLNVYYLKGIKYGTNILHTEEE